MNTTQSNEQNDQNTSVNNTEQQTIHNTATQDTSAQKTASPSKELNHAKQKISSFLNKHKVVLSSALIIAVGGLMIGYDLGKKQGMSKVGYTADEEELAETIQKQNKSIESMTIALNTATQERDVAVDNSKKLTEDLERVKQEHGLNESLLNTYRQKLRERGGLGLSIHNLAIKPLPEDAYEYVLDLVQVNPSNRTTTGRIELRLINGDQILSIPMEESSFSFTNYQRLSGRWTMPRGFTPQYIEVHLLNAGEPVIQRFIWQRGKAEVESDTPIDKIPQTKAEAR